MSQNIDKSEENSVAIQLMKQDFLYMKQGIDDIKKSLVDLKKEIMSGFVTKSEFDNLKKRVDEHEANVSWAIKIIIGAIILAVLALVRIGA